ncbi:MAG: M15 family metallopeptidase [Gemmatimonadaceae bacterium]|nr:M15 family metallopeptidase [Gemmatimonadaceae bacterium]
MNVVSMMNPLPPERASVREQNDTPRDPSMDVAPRSARREPARAAGTRAARPSREARDVRDAKATDEATSTDDAGEKRPVTRSEFSALLAMLAGAGEQVRNDLVKQLPEEGASLVDHLLEEASQQGGNAEALMSAAATTNATATANGNANGITTAQRSKEAGEALHYGLLKLLPNTGADAGDVANSAEPPASKGNLDGLARAASRVSEQASDRSRALEAISRVASQRGSSVEQLLALGDTRGAAARQSLDALLNAAGTPAGARLAARELMAATRRSVLGGDDATLDAMASLEALKAKASKTMGASGDITVASKDMTGIAPELQTKVQRVMERMKNEYGHDVTIVETTRSQARQDWLYEQGRTREGNVVTWTRDSAHTRGDAVDVMIDGTYNNPEGFARLQRIAREEGLRTLGARDPGHLELTRNGADATGTLLASAQKQARDAAAADTASQPSARGMARVASVAGVAGVAQVAQSARDARGTDTFANNGIGSTVSAYASAQSNGRGRTESDANDTTGNSAREKSPRGLALGRTARAESGSESAAFSMNSMGVGQQRGRDVAVNAPQHVTGSAQADRVADIQQMRADAPTGPLSRMTLNVDGADGTAERITVDVRGSTVTAHIATDADTADRLRLRTAELQDALGRHGLDGDTVRISSTSRTQDGTESARGLTGERDALKMVATAASQQDGASANGQQGRAPRQWDMQDETRREQAARARDEREQRSRQDAQDQQERQRRQTFFTGNA